MSSIGPTLRKRAARHQATVARDPGRETWAPTWRVATCLALAGLLSAGCAGDILDSEVDDSRVLATELETADRAPLLVASAIGDFECALAHYIVGQGLLADELADAQSSDVTNLDRRTLSPSTGTYGTATCTDVQLVGVYTPLSIARYQADRAYELLERSTDAVITNRRTLMGQVSAYAGYSLLLLGEGMCSAAVDVGPELTPAQLFQLAEARFTRALEHALAASDATTRNMALIGRARTRLDLGNPVTAREDALLVPQGFVKTATYSGASARRENRVWAQSSRNLFVTTEPAFRGLTYAGVADPRVPVVNAGSNGTDGFTPLWRQAKYPAIGTPIPIARWEEARLIVAESEGGAAAVGIIDDFHRRAGLPLFSATNPQPTAEAILTQVIDERRRELFLEGHRLGDIRRYRIPLSPAASTPYATRKGGTYGDFSCFPLPDVERLNNPNVGAR